jgi:pectin methylesterase-like acyl-CoA thioesterase
MNKMFKRQLSALLSFVMLFTTAFMGTSVSSVYASGGDDDVASFTETGISSVYASDDKDDVASDAAIEAIEALDTDSSDDASETLDADSSDDASEVPTLVGNGKIDVWDFGAEQLDSAKYNNMLTVDEINAQYPGVAAGTANVNPPAEGFSFNNGELVFNGNGKTNHRIRTDNTAITRYDSSTKKDADGNVYHGYLYSNAGSSTEVTLGIKLYKNDILTAIMSSNGQASKIRVTNEAGEIVDESFTYTPPASGNCAPMTFYAPEDGMYYLASVNEKLVVARLYREHTQPVKVSGEVRGDSFPEGDFSVKFTNKQTGVSTLAKVNADKTYSCCLYEQYDYDVTLDGVNTYIVNMDSPEYSIAKGAGDVTFNVPIAAVELETFTGNVVGVDADDIANLTASALTFSSNNVYVPEISISGTDIELTLEKDVEYTVSIDSSFDDYTLKTTSLSSNSADKNIVFEKKPLHKVTIVPEGAAAADLKDATLTFKKITVGGYDIDAQTNANGNMAYADGNYVYTFTGIDNIALRDGQYQIKVTGAGDGASQKVTSDVKVNGADVTKTVPFTKEIPTEWVFTNASFWESGVDGVYQGIDASAMQTFKSHSVGSSAKGGKLLIPVSGPSTITVSACYDYQFQFENEEEVNEKTGSTAQIDKFTYEYTGSAGYATLNVGADKTSYLVSISVATAGTPYKEVITVGKDKDYQTISEAVKAAEAMSRPEGEDGRVTIMIDPGNYEEIVIVKGDYISLVNASETDDDASKIELTDQGRGIGANAVRITSYYGEGAAYYSMGSDSCYDADVLAANKENGYFTTKNAGGSSANYWNSTVVVKGSDFEADGIIFENSFNQYVSEKEANDVVVASNSNFKAGRTELSKKAGDLTVQRRQYVERASGLAVIGDRGVYNNVRIVGRQDSLYNASGARAVFSDSVIMGGVDFIFGGATLVFSNCDLVANVCDRDSNDVAYLTASQTPAGQRGYLFVDCTVRSVIPQTESSNTELVQPAYFGRPWSTTGEAVFVNTTIETGKDGQSMIAAAAWSNSLSGESAGCAEYNSIEVAEGVDNSAKRASWSTALTSPVLSDGTALLGSSFLAGSDYWNPDVSGDMYGDVDGDGIYTAADASLYLKISRDSDLPQKWGLDTSVIAKLTKLAKDGASTITSQDAKELLEKARNNDYIFPVFTLN